MFCFLACIKFKWYFQALFTFSAIHFVHDQVSLIVLIDAPFLLHVDIPAHTWIILIR